ncbi:aldehyde dehydrogenase family protein [Rhodococcus sp. ACS1]|uniref:aldehyde dehydrogenase family protein n=1 Tax=Rhodococcus sp. ACS1 TaxID=2028570 RepID=UPI00117B0927
MKLHTPSVNQGGGSPERLYIAGTIYDEFVPKLVAQTQALKLGKGAAFDYDIGTLTSQRQFDNVERAPTTGLDSSSDPRIS